MLKVPQVILGVDVGHICVLVGEVSLGFYSRNYRQGLPLVSVEDGVLVSPDPLFAKADAIPSLRARITPIYHGTLSEEQAQRLNEWTDDAMPGGLSVLSYVTSAGEARERSLATWVYNLAFRSRHASHPRQVCAYGI